MKTAVMTDTNSGISAARARELGILLLPMPVIIDGRSYLEGVDLQAEQLYDAMRRGQRVSTSQPSPGSITALWDAALEEGFDEIAYIPMSSSLSGSCHSARLLAEDYAGRVTVVDNRRISVTQMASVLEARRMAEAGSSAREIRRVLEEEALQASIYLTVSSLKYLQMGGRLSQTAAMVGTVLQIRPILSIQGGQVELADKARGAKGCERKMLDALCSDVAARFARVPAGQLRVALAGTLQREADIGPWRQAVQARFPQMAVDYAPLPCSIACHVGPDSVGVAAMVTRAEQGGAP